MGSWAELEDRILTLLQCLKDELFCFLIEMQLGFEHLRRKEMLLKEPFAYMTVSPKCTVKVLGFGERNKSGDPMAREDNKESIWPLNTDMNIISAVKMGQLRWFDDVIASQETDIQLGIFSH